MNIADVKELEWNGLSKLIINHNSLATKYSTKERL